MSNNLWLAPSERTSNPAAARNRRATVRRAYKRVDPTATVDPDTGARIRPVSTLESYNQLPANAWAVRFN